jgi:hypothetical protein
LLWCSLSVRGAGLRIEAMRFALLVVLTVALLSVAFRINAHHASTSAKAPSRPTATPSIQTSTPAQLTPSTTTTPAQSAAPRKAGRAGHPSSGGAGGGQPTGTGQPTLPVTGWDETVKLGALALLLISGGAVAVRAGSPRRRALVQPPPLQPTVQD